MNMKSYYYLIAEGTELTQYSNFYIVSVGSSKGAQLAHAFLKKWCAQMEYYYVRRSIEADEFICKVASQIGVKIKDLPFRMITEHMAVKFIRSVGSLPTHLLTGPEKNLVRAGRAHSSLLSPLESVLQTASAGLRIKPKVYWNRLLMKG